MKLITNGRLITRDAEGRGYYEHGAVAYEGARIAEVGEEAALRAKYPDAEIVDAKGGVIMPAFINAHTHIYSALARGLSIVGNNPTNFYEVLDGTWWAIDRHLMMDGTKASATALYIDSIKQGVTTRRCSAVTRSSPSPIRPSTAWSRPTTAAPAITSMSPRA